MSEVHLACGSVGALLAQAPAPAGWLSGSERARLAAMKTQARRAQFLAARWQVRTLLAQVAGGEPAQWLLDAPHDAPPTVRTDPRWQVSISHSADHIAAAVAQADGLRVAPAMPKGAPGVEAVIPASPRDPCPLGIDLEVPRRPRDIEGLIALSCTVAEQRLLAHAPQRASLFYELWTVKESWLKARREGVAPARLQQLEAVPDATGEVRTWDGDGQWLALCAGPGGRPRWWSDPPRALRTWRVRDFAPQDPRR